jgi:hypothetical protein
MTPRLDEPGSPGSDPRGGAPGRSVSTGEHPSSTGTADAPRARPLGPVRHRGWLEIRWRQFRRAPRPVVRAVASSLVVAVILGTAYLAYDVALIRGAQPPGGDLRLAFAVVYVLGVLIAGSAITWLVVPLPTGSGRRTTRTPWSAALGLFAAVPIAYLVFVVLIELFRPLVT